MGQSRRLLLFCGFLVTLLAIAGCGSSSAPPAVSTQTPLPLATVPPAGAFSAALVTDVGGLHDRSFNQLAWQGLERAKRNYGVKISNVESRTESAYAPNLRRLAQHYATLIIAVGYSMSRAVYDVAQEFPQQRFAMVDARPLDRSGQQVTLSNVEDILFKEQESGYLAGVVAGLMEKRRVGRATHNAIGYLGGSAIPAVDHYLAGYVAGAEKVDPTIRVLGEYARTFLDSNLGMRIGLRQISQGADILFQVAGKTGDGYLAAARKKRVYGIGADIDESYLGPFIITSAVKHVDRAVAESVRAALRSRFHGGDQLFGSTIGATGIARPASVVPVNVFVVARRFENEIRSGTIVPPSSVPAR
jgi:basic membrane protein A and related proteins